MYTTPAAFSAKSIQYSNVQRRYNEQASFSVLISNSNVGYTSKTVQQHANHLIPFNKYMLLVVVLQTLYTINPLPESLYIIHTGLADVYPLPIMDPLPGSPK